jgi:hypothetical protein
MSAKVAPVALQEKHSGDRFPCEVPTTCQPPSAYCKDPWPATIRDIGNRGLRLTLGRRFERGSGLAIELPTEDGTTTTVLTRVVEVHTHADGGWLLGCDFISELSDEEVQFVLTLDPVHPPAFDDKPRWSTPAIRGVLFQVVVHKREILRWYVKHLAVAAGWPLPGGKEIALRVGGLPTATPPLQIRVRDCRLFGSYWIIEGKLLAEPTDEVILALTTGPTMDQTR